MSDIYPTHGIAYFLVTKEEINEILEFTYWDPHEHYTKIVLENPKKYDEEINILWKNMQRFLDEEIVKVNGITIKPKVTFVGIVPRGFKDVITISYHIQMKNYLKDGKNVFETKTNEEIAEYDFDIFWFFPEKTKVTSVISKLEYEWKENKLLLWARKGMHVGGYEKIEVFIS